MDERAKFGLNEYIMQGEPSQIEKARAWKTAIGLQAVDGLKTSDFLLENAQKHIEGEMTIDEVKSALRDYYVSRQARTDDEKDEEEADKVSANITKLLSTPDFTFSMIGLASIHKSIFEGVFKHAGTFRDYEISKKEWVLEEDSVYYSSCRDIRAALEYDMEMEKNFSYKGLSADEMVEHISKFVSGLWQIHPFREGNTRATAVFVIKYLRQQGFNVENDMFHEHSWYFRNALVRANYSNAAKQIERNSEFLVRFFRNLLLGENNELKNRHCHIRWNEESDSTPNKYRTSTEQAPNKLAPENPNVKALVEVIGARQMTIKEMLSEMNLKHRPNFLEVHLKPAIEGGYVQLLYPDSPRHPRQRYLLTIKGLAYYNSHKGC